MRHHSTGVCVIKPCLFSIQYVQLFISENHGRGRKLVKKLKERFEAKFSVMNTSFGYDLKWCLGLKWCWMFRGNAAGVKKRAHSNKQLMDVIFSAFILLVFTFFCYHKLNNYFSNSTNCVNCGKTNKPCTSHVNPVQYIINCYQTPLHSTHVLGVKTLSRVKMLTGIHQPHQ